jgi:hypothetical protein
MARKQDENLSAHESASEDETSVAADAPDEDEALRSLIRQRDLLFQWHIVRGARDVRFAEYKRDDNGNALLLLNTHHGDLVLPVAKENLMAAAMKEKCYELDASQSLRLTPTLQFEKHLRSCLRGLTSGKKTSAKKRTRSKKPPKDSAKTSGSAKATSPS